MKTKIIYISGNEIFEMADIRAAFNEVRETLGLDNNTVLFGVPVDNDSAFEEKNIAEPTQENIKPQEIKENLQEIVKQQNTSSLKPKQEENSASDKIIPILSILSANQTPEEEMENMENLTSTEETTGNQNSSEYSKEIIKTEPIEELKEEENVSIEDIMINDAPIDESEKTLEDLLESMTPLQEDRIEEDFIIEPEEEQNKSSNMNSDFVSSDATLEQLANEFAETEDKIIVKSKTETQGKIGKLKNILPFKKAKKDDTGLMGDLFGWAGIAANDEEISIPGIFSDSPQKK